MSCFNEGTNHTGGSRGVPGGAETGKGGRRSRLKASRRAQQQASEDPKKGRLGAEAAGQKSPSARNVKRLRSLERIFKGQPNDSNSMETTALPMKIEYANCLSDNGRFKEAMSVLIDILDERHESKTASSHSSNSSITPAECGVGAVGPELSRGAGAKLCSAPVLCAQDLLDDEQESEADEMTHQAFKHYVNTLAQTTIDLANKSTVFLRQINIASAKNMQSAAALGDPDPSAASPGGQFVDYKVSPGQITPCPWSCPHCSGVLIEPISLGCGHTYCRECMLKMARAERNAKRAACLKCGSLWFPLEQSKKKTESSIPAAEGSSADPTAAAAERTRHPAGTEPDGQGAALSQQPGNVGESIPSGVTAPPPQQGTNAEDGGSKATDSLPPPKNPLEAFARLKINVTVQQLVEKYWKNDIESVAHRQKGNKFFKGNRPAEAIKAYSKAIDLASSADQYSLSNRSNALTKLGEHEASLRDAEAAVNARPDWAKGYFRKGAALQKLDRHEEAFHTLFQCVSIERAKGDDAKTAVAEAAKSLMIILDKNRRDNTESTPSVVGAFLQATRPVPVPGMQRKSPSCNSLGALSVDSGLGGCSQQSSYSSSLNSLASVASNSKSSCGSSGSEREKTTEDATGETADNAPTTTGTARIPPFVQDMVDYVSLMHEKQSNMQALKRPKDTWFMRGILTYRKAYRSIADEAIDASDYECPLCYRQFWQPVVTGCGHTYCKVCLEQALDHNPQCPQCRTTITGMPGIAGDDAVPNEFVECSMRRLLPTEYDERKNVHMAEIQNISTEEGGTDMECSIPVFVCTIAAPNIPCPLHIFEPRYRLMIRRAMESGTRAFGMSCNVGDNDAPFADYGTMLEIRDVQYFGDGRSVIDTIGGRRFKVLSRSERDGYDTAKVEFIQDVMPKREELRELHELHDQTFWVAGTWFAMMSQDIKSGILMHYGNMPEPEGDYHLLPNGPSWTWWLLLILPLAPSVQIQVLSTTSLKKRLQMTAHILKLVSQQSRGNNRL